MFVTLFDIDVEDAEVLATSQSKYDLTIKYKTQKDFLDMPLDEEELEESQEKDEEREVEFKIKIY